MYTSLLKSLTLNNLCQMANDIDLYDAYVNPEVAVKSELIKDLNERFHKYPGIFHSIKMDYFSVHGQPVHREDLTLATDEITGETLVLLRSAHPEIKYTPVLEGLEVFEEVYMFLEEGFFQPTGCFSLTKHDDIEDDEFEVITRWLPLGSTKFISHHDLCLLNQTPYYLVKYKCKFDKVWKESLFSTYLKACQFQSYILHESYESEIVLLTLDEDECVE